MKKRKLLYVLMSILIITTLVGGFRNAAATPTIPTDESKVPHYFGPNPNWALSPLRSPNVFVEFTGGGGGGAAAAATVDLQRGPHRDHRHQSGQRLHLCSDGPDHGIGDRGPATAVVDYSGVVTGVTVLRVRAEAATPLPR